MQAIAPGITTELTESVIDEVLIARTVNGRSTVKTVRQELLETYDVNDTGLVPSETVLVRRVVQLLVAAAKGKLRRPGRRP